MFYARDCLHIIATFLITTGLLAVHKRRSDGSWIFLGLALVPGIAKELYDWLGHPSLSSGSLEYSYLIFESAKDMLLNLFGFFLALVLYGRGR